jgi:type III secretory pathway component EscU
MGKAFMFTGATLIGMFVLNLTMLIGVPGYIMFLLTLIGGFAFFYYYYEVTFLKTLAVLGLGIVFSVVVSILLSVIGFTLGISLFGQLFSSGSNLREMTGSSMNNIQFDMPIDQY